VRTHHGIIHLLIAAAVFLLGPALLTSASAQSDVDFGKKDPSSKNQTRMGINVSEYTDVDALGFLSLKEVRPWGHLFSDETDRILLALRDTVYVAFDSEEHVKPGDRYTVFHSSCEQDHPLTGRDLGYVISYLGTVLIKSEVKPGIFKAEVIQSYKPMQIGNPVIPFQPVSPCVQITSPETGRSDLSAQIDIPVAAAKDLMQVIGQFSIVYMNHGHAQGIQRGNLFQIMAPPESDHPRGPTAPDRVLGYVLILEARPETSTGLVITAKREFRSGTMLRPVHLKEVLRNRLSYCGIDYKEADLQHNPLDVLKRLVQQVGSQINLPEAFLLLSSMPKCPVD
jgi:hypothetical protein